MKRKLTEFVIIIICFLLETTIFRYLSIASVTPNLLVLVTSSFGFMCGKKEGLFVGFLSGLITDIFFGIGNMIGFYALIYALIGYGNGMFRKLYYDEDIKLPLLLIAGSEFLYGIIIYITMFMMRNRFDFVYYLKYIIMPELMYTILITLGLYQIILHINRRLEDKEKRSASKFV